MKCVLNMSYRVNHTQTHNSVVYIYIYASCIHLSSTMEKVFIPGFLVCKNGHLFCIFLKLCHSYCYPLLNWRQLSIALLILKMAVSTLKLGRNWWTVGLVTHVPWIDITLGPWAIAKSGTFINPFILPCRNTFETCSL